MNGWFDLAAPAWRLAGWTMLHFMWAGTLVALAGAALRIACRRAAPGVRYGVSLMTLVLLAALPVGIGAWLSMQPEFAASASKPPALPVDSASPVAADQRVAQQSRRLSEEAPTVIDLAKTAPEADAIPIPADEETTALRSVATGDRARLVPSLPGRGIDGPLDRVVDWLPVVWLVGAPLTFALLAAGLVGSRRLRAGAVAIVDGPVFEACRRLEQSLGMARRVALAACDRLAQPVLVGIVRPTILLPASALTGWTVEELEMVLLHELAHVRRWDNLVNLAQRVIESLLFFHPCVWLTSRQVQRDREECCDAVVVRHTARPEEYASLLVSIAVAMRGSRSARLATALATASAMADHPLAGRVRRILKLEEETMRVSRGTVVATVLLGAALVGGLYYRGANVEAAEPKPATIEAPDAKDDSDPVYLVVYSIPDNNQIRPSALLRILATHGVEIKWFEDKSALIVSARRGVHEQLTAFLAEARKASKVSASEFPKLKAEIGMLQTQLNDVEKELADIEVLKQVAIQHARSPASLEAAVQAAMDKDPTVANYRQQLFDLSTQIQALTAKNGNNTQLKRLQSAYSQTDNAMKQYRVQAEKDARDQLAKIPNEALRAALVEYTVRKKYLDEKKIELEKKLSAIQSRLAELAVGGAGAEGGDREAGTGGTSPPDRAGGDEKQTLVAGLPDDMSPDDARQLVRQLRGEGYDAYAILAEQGGIHLEVRNLNAKFALTWTESIADGKRHYNFRLTTPPESPTPPTGPPTATDPSAGNVVGPGQMLGTIDDRQAALRAERAAQDRELGLETGATPAARIEKMYVAEVLPGMNEEDARRVANDLETAGHTARVLTDGELRIEIRTFIDHPRLVWETRTGPDGQPQKVARVVSHQFDGMVEWEAAPPALPNAEGFAAPAESVALGADEAAGPFLSAKDQQTADLAYAALAWELEPLRPDELEAVKKAGFKGGVRVERNDSSRSSPRAGALLVGLHTWSVESFDHLLEILSSKKFAELESVKFYFLAKNGTLELPNWPIQSDRVQLKRRGTGASRRNTPEAVAELYGSEALAPGDVVVVRLAEDAAWNPNDRELTIGPDGTLTLPLIGRVSVAGLTVAEAEAAIVKPLAKFFKDPSLQITIVQKALGGAAAPDDVSPGDLGATYPPLVAPDEAPTGATHKDDLTLVAAGADAITSDAGRVLRKLSPGDTVLLRAVGALPDAPLNNKYRIEAEGTLALGPAYGRVVVAGLTVIDAEAAIVSQLKKTLTNVEVQLVVVGVMANPVAPLPEPRKLADGDEIVVRVNGALPDQPLDDAYRIESGGTIPLGPTYGRVAVAGLTIAEAEKAIETHLKTILTDPHVQVTLKANLYAAASDNGGGNRAAPSKAVFLYDGKTFGEWRGVLNKELSLSRRNGAVSALAAFARAGQGREAVEAIFDVAIEYDFRTMSVGSVEGELKESVVDNLTTTSRTRVSELDWLPELQERLTADGKKWKWLAVQLLTRLTTGDESAKEILEKLGTSDDDEIRQAAKAASERGLPKPNKGAALSSDPLKQATGWQAPPGGSYRY